MTSSKSIQRVKIGDLWAFKIRSGDATAVILEQGSQLLSYGFEGEEPVIWESPHAKFERGTAVRGGVPVCWPWFGDMAWNSERIQSMCTSADSPPFHGLVRDRDWQLDSIQLTDSSIGVTFGFEMIPNHSTLWPHHARLQLSFTVGESITLELTTENLGKRTLAISQALHSYYAVSNAENIRFIGFSGLKYFDVLDNWKMKTQCEEPTIRQETTRAYIGTPNRFIIEDQAWQRRIVVSTQGSRSAILWNPWKERAALIDQFRSDSWKDMVCLETARMAEDSLLLEPGDIDKMALNISVERLNTSYQKGHRNI
ncbi:D-hexose-6-phosphate mutarotase [Pseudomonas sp. NFACC13-1]|uniref:D-hexose-6-phosphate mutarotase n=1 Tax=Pseudomonas sp. NFACC13-1 TaxID=1566245 RepID=UPI000881C76F|nr:D-hexose-6-phosphate mutarotase [Pseudomonas sp. NFACC13-1]SDB67541.1 glucose-6-phosphate 1-epimerase [Pseudomonas sp. NFACC13-1]